MSEPQYAEGETYLVVRGRKSYHDWVLGGFKTLKNKPAVDSDEIAIKLKLKLPVALFTKPTLSATVAIDGEVPQLELSPETIGTVQDLIRSQTGLDIELTVLGADSE